MIKEDGVFWAVVRVLVTLIVIVIINVVLRGVNPYIVTMTDLILIWVFDPLDSVPMKKRYGKFYAKTFQYQLIDKVADIILEFAVLLIHTMRVGVLGAFEKVFIFLFVYRLVGTVLYAITRNGGYLVLFANFFMDNVIVYIFLRYVLKLRDEHVITLTLLSVPAKMLYEYVHHVIIVP